MPASKQQIDQAADVQICLQASPFIDSDQDDIIAFAREHCADPDDDIGRAVALYLAVRDEVVYDPYYIGPDASYFRASDCLRNGRGFCIPKAALMAACCRAAGIPARVGYADVRNHLSTKKLDELIGSNVYRWHSYTDVYLQGQWVKATPAFNNSLCEKFAVHTLEFDGRNDSLFQEFDTGGRRHMEYVRQRGPYIDVPHEHIVQDFARHHPKWLHNRRQQPAENWD